MTEPLLAADRRPEGALATLRRGLAMMPEFRQGLPVTFGLALLATAGNSCSSSSAWCSWL